MLEGRAFFFSVFLALFLIPPTVSADYLYPGTAGFQPLAVIEPATPDSLFYSWTGEADRDGKTNLGTSIDFLRNTDNSKDWDIILSATGAFRTGERLSYGITVPYIIRDPEFNESDLLDLRAFTRIALLRGSSGLNLSGELSAIFPSASQGNTYPFTLDSTVAGARFALSGKARDMRLGLNIGYQRYLQSVSGQDADLLYSLWMERPLKNPWSLAAEYAGSTHTHSGAPGDDEVSDAYFSLGVTREQSEKMDLGLAAAVGVGGETAADLRLKMLLTVKLGTVEKKKDEEKPREKTDRKKRKPAATVSDTAPSQIIAILIAESVTDKSTEKRITRALQKQGYATGLDPDPGIKSRGKNVLYYMPGMQEKAIKVSRTLTFGGHLSDLHIEESPVPITGKWLLLVLGGEK